MVKCCGRGMGGWRIANHGGSKNSAWPWLNWVGFGLGDLLGLLPAEFILQVCLFFSLAIKKSKYDGEPRPGLCLWVVLKMSFVVMLPSFSPVSLSPTHFCSLVNSVIMPYFKYVVIKCHCNSPWELFDMSLISFLTLNMLLCVLPLYLFGIYKVSGIQHCTQELIGKQNTDMECDWRGDVLSFGPAAVSLLHCQNSDLWLCSCAVIVSDKRHKEELSEVVHLPISMSERREGLQPSSVNNLKGSLEWRDWQWQEKDWNRRNRDWRDAFMRLKEQKNKESLLWPDLF